MYQKVEENPIENTKSQDESNAIRDAIVDVLKDSGIDVIVSDEEGQRILDETKGNVRAEEKDVNDAFNSELQRQIDGNQEKGHIYKLGKPSNVLKFAGVEDLPIEMAASIKEIPISNDRYYRVTTISELNNALSTGKLSTPAISMFDNAILNKVHQYTNMSFEELENLNKTIDGQEQIRKIWRDNNISILAPRAKVS